MAQALHKHTQFDQPQRDEEANLSPLLSFLRILALDCRASARTDLFKACALLSHETGTNKEEFGKAFVRGLGQALRKRPVFRNVTEPTMSFDEAWIVRLASAIKSSDEDTVQFLLRSRIAPEAQRNIRYLISEISHLF